MKKVNEARQALMAAIKKLGADSQFTCAAGG